MDNINNSNLGQELGWDAEITQESQFILLPAGDYDFTIKALERGRFAGSDKMCACNMATITLEVRDPATGEAVELKDSLYLNSKAEWKLSQFFLAIGQKKHGEPLRPNWNAVVGSRGKCEITINEYQKDGETRKNNRIRNYKEYTRPSFQNGRF